MEISFYKYEGTGNDFVMIDNRALFFPKEDHALVKHLCDRRFGIGGDGLILLENDVDANFKMVYYNSDGNPSSMCGNGGRCIVAFAKQLGLITEHTVFSAVDGIHHATIFDPNIVSLQMSDVADIAIQSDYVFLNTGSPHHVTLVEDLRNTDVKAIGSQIRYGQLYGEKGSNVNFVKQTDASTFAIRTYERGVEDETLSCGTGATAVAIAMHALGKTSANSIVIFVEGGKLEVSFVKEGNAYTDVCLKGPATFVFKGSIEC
jgi:diaminopimelate epimerase